MEGVSALARLSESDGSFQKQHWEDETVRVEKYYKHTQWQVAWEDETVRVEKYYKHTQWLVAWKTSTSQERHQLFHFLIRKHIFLQLTKPSWYVVSLLRIYLLFGRPF